MSFVPKVRRIHNAQELSDVLALARENNDGCSLPTHVVVKNGEIVGCASIALVPVLMLWHHSDKIGPKESIQLKHTYESIMEEKGINIQHAENGGEFFIKELGYWVDGYDAENNVVYEWDEKEHYTSKGLREKDKKRQKEIEEFLKCEFIRIRENH